MLVLLEDTGKSGHGVLAAVFVVAGDEGDLRREFLSKWHGK